ncbi:hypothetical protein DL98DRAFT_289736 [Cadophora sp. DSE1049]|nr:hypothetical protein DL98DRAFT_289736 [Cadophora sp. DSE1049]
MEKYQCGCSCCHEGSTDDEALECAREERLSSHSLQVCKLLVQNIILVLGYSLTVVYRKAVCSRPVTLRVGPQKSISVTSQIIISFYSRFVEAALYGFFQESQTDRLELLEDDAEAISSFVLWAETGQIYSSLQLEELWALGKRLQSDLFTNEVMHCLFTRDASVNLLTKDVELAYSLSDAGSKLRAYFRRQIVTEGPLSNKQEMS